MSNIVVLMRGLPGSGKSTWIRDHGASEHVISPDEVRLMLSPPVPAKDNPDDLRINQETSVTAWSIAYHLLEWRLQRIHKGEARGATFFDATLMTKRAIQGVIDVIRGADEQRGDGKKTRIVILDFTETGVKPRPLGLWI